MSANSKIDNDLEPAPSIGRLIPPPDATPSVPRGATREQCVMAWFDLVEATDRILMAALRSRHGTPAQAEAAYKACHDRLNDEHDQKVREMLLQFERRRGRHGR